ncbi:putative IQ motif, EF-hand binding protein [Rosa chinensis]|uniref:Putative IQ motif, EF-hand binding protein n=1 Tax=Rosa chinensis TaxID=74649 RepID=A0A2P6R381_ROSCH|nr:putative IQ motif, EF-hand binding protein [Rosa chinensis]
MGKTPGKWIKNLLLGKKSSRSSLSKGREKSATKGETVVSSKLSVPELTVSAPVISPPFVGTVVSNVDSEIRAAVEIPNDNITLSSAKEDGQTQAISSSGSQDLQRINREEAATKAQSAYRGYVARRAYRTLKGIIRLQALIRGHLVRRQAVSTLLCVQGIVKFQALIRGQHVRHSDIGVEVHKTHQGATCFDYSGVSASSQVDRLSKNAFAQKLLASLPTASPLRLQYDPEDPNSAWVWLDRWTRSCFWEPVLQLKKKPDPKSRGKYKKIQTVETEPAKPKRTVRRLSTENGPNRVTSDTEKPKRNMRKVSSHPMNSVQEHQQNGVEKVKSNVRKVSGPKEVSNSKKVSDTKEEVSDSKEEVSDQPEVDKEIPKHSTETILAPAVLDDSEQHTSEISPKIQHVEVSVSKHSDLEECMELPPTDETLQKLDDHPSVDMQSMEKNGKNEEVQALNEVLTSADNFISNEDQKTSQRRASLPVKFDHRDNGVQTTPRVPSYMAPTESARARLKGQSSPRFARDVIDKNLLTRRHSLSSSTNTKLSLLSPRAQKLAQGKGVIRTDRSLSSSRDGFDKGIQPEWRR